MTIDNIVSKFISSPYMLEMGAGKLAKRLNCEKEDIYEAKLKARKSISDSEIADLQDYISKQEDQIAKYTGSDRTNTSQIKNFESTRPLSPEEISKLAGVDGINTYVSRVWDKLLPSGKWVYSIDIRYNIEGFYSKEELADKLKELLPSYDVKTLPVVLPKEEKILNILMGDDHCGMVNTTNLFNAEFWTEETYIKRLVQTVEAAKSYNQVFEEVHIISLGDQLNGFNKLTTRGGHEVNSLSNKEQFDFYVNGRRVFIDALANSGLSNSYIFHEVDNSNHSGLGFSYMANKLLQTYIESKYPQMTYISTTDMIDGFEYGSHVITFAHGKDEKFQKRPFPLNIDQKTDLYIYDYLSHKGYNPNKQFITFYKGDLHTSSYQEAKFGRYVNVPSIAGNSDYGDINFGNTRAGTLLEIISKNSRRIQSEVISF